MGRGNPPTKETTMRFVMFMYPGIDTDAESWEPSAEDVAAMSRYFPEDVQEAAQLSERPPEQR
jgi:hypothetical protein